MVPSAQAYSRFLSNLMSHSQEVETMFEELVKQVTWHLPDFGVTLAVDGKAVQ